MKAKQNKMKLNLRVLNMASHMVDRKVQYENEGDTEENDK